MVKRLSSSPKKICKEMISKIPNVYLWLFKDEKFEKKKRIPMKCEINN